MTSAHRRWSRWAAAALCLMASLPVVAQPKAEVRTTNRTVSAVGHASEQIAPDLAVLTFGIEIHDPSTTQAVIANRRMTAKLVSALKRMGIESSHMSVAPYEMAFVPTTFVPALGTNQKVEFQIQQKGSYKVTSIVTVTVRVLSDVSKLIDTAVEAGVDRIDAVRYLSTRRQSIEEKLLPQAIADAKSRAASIAEDIGFTLGEPLEVATLPTASTDTVQLPGANTGDARVNVPLLTVEAAVRVTYRAVPVN